MHCAAFSCNHEQAMPRDPDPRCLQTRQRLSAYHAPVVASHSASAGTPKGRGGDTAGGAGGGASVVLPLARGGGGGGGIVRDCTV
eukprot:8417016-Alexandrium_andersonii.AAC.1